MVKETYFSLIEGHLYKIGADEILHKYLPEHKRQIILTEAHSGTGGGHYAWQAIVQFFLRAGLWWPTLHKDEKEHNANRSMERT